MGPRKVGAESRINSDGEPVNLLNRHVLESDFRNGRCNVQPPDLCHAAGFVLPSVVGAMAATRCGQGTG